METSKDYTSVYRHARDLARKLERYWKFRGLKDIQVWVEQDKTMFSKPIYFVRSNLKLTWAGDHYKLSTTTTS